MLERLTKTHLLLAFCFLPFAATSRSQSAIDVGGIMTVNYIDGGEGKSPLRHNDGLPGFELVGDLFLNVRVSEEASVFLELETVRGWNVQLYAGSLTYKISGEKLKVEAGKFLAPFGNFLPRRFAPQNFLYGFPIYYDYRTGLAANEVPENNQELLAARGTGRGDYGNTASAHSLFNRMKANFSPNSLASPATGHTVNGSDGVKVIAKETYISGVQFFGKYRQLGYNIGLANGALSNPADLSVSKRPMIFGRLHVQPAIGLRLGVSAANGGYLNHKLVQSQHPEIQPEKYSQGIAGLDMEYSRGYFVFFGEGAFSRWKSPLLREKLDALALTVEARYKFSPRFFVSTRYGQIKFSQIADAGDVDGDGQTMEPWEFPIWRLEAALGYNLSRHALIKAAWQINRTDLHHPRNSDPADDLLAIQMTVFY